MLKHKLRRTTEIINFNKRPSDKKKSKEKEGTNINYKIIWMFNYKHFSKTSYNTVYFIFHSTHWYHLSAAVQAMENIIRWWRQNIQILYMRVCSL
jgi:hypothetical protein